MKKFGSVVFVILALVIGTIRFILPVVQANDEHYVFEGLYLIGEYENIQLEEVDIELTVNDKETTTITATYEISNTGEDTAMLEMGMPLPEREIRSVIYRFAPYVYNSKVVSGEAINERISSGDTNYNRWRVFGFPLALHGGETKVAQVEYTVDQFVEKGKNIFALNTDHVDSWGDFPDAFQIEAGFNPRTVQHYNFDRDFSIEPTEYTEHKDLIWRFSKGDELGNITFHYYPVDEILLEQLSEAPGIDAFINAYRSNQFEELIEIGKSRIEAIEEEAYQDRIYLFMADAYMQQNEYKNALSVYDLISTDSESILSQNKGVQNKVASSKVRAYLELQRYEELYDFVHLEIDDEQTGYFMAEFIEQQMSQVPPEDIAKIEEARKPKSEFEMMLDRFLSGTYTMYAFGGILILIIVVLLILYIRKKRKDRFFF